MTVAMRRNPKSQIPNPKARGFGSGFGISDFPAQRGGYTLLEVLLAAGIALLLMSALYVGMDVQLRSAQEGREVVDRGTLARVLLARIGRDLRGSLTPVTAAQTAAAAATGTGTTAATDPAVGTGTDPAAAVGTDAAPAVGFAPTPLNMGVQGDAGVLNIYVCAAHLPGARPGRDDGPAVDGDLCRITYWLAQGGLAKRETTRVTADDELGGGLAGVEDEGRYVIAPEVVGLQFNYFDGTGYVDNWDGSQIGADGKTPIGPPRGVEILLTIRHEGTRGGPAREKTYRHFVALGAANAQPTEAGLDTMGTAGGTGTSGTGMMP
jgi:hypothetical protein